MAEESSRQLTQIARGVVQANARLGRLLELAERQQAGGGGAEVVPIEPLLDLLQAIDDSLAAGGQRPLAAPAPWWRRLFAQAPPPSDDSIRQGLELARQRAHQQLAALGVHRSPTTGAPDPQLHRVLAVLPCPAGGEPGAIARVHVHGWCRDGVDGPESVRVADVSVYEERVS